MVELHDDVKADSLAFLALRVKISSPDRPANMNTGGQVSGCTMVQPNGESKEAKS
jgi:hypothetical protein